MASGQKQLNEFTNIASLNASDIFHVQSNISAVWRDRKFTLANLASQISGMISGGFGTAVNTGSLTSVFYPLNSNPSNYLVSSDLANYITASQTGAFYPRTNPSGFITSGQTGVFASDLELGTAISGLSSVYYPLVGNPSNFVTTAQTGVFASDLEVSTAIAALSSVYYPLVGNPSSFITTGQTGVFASDLELSTAIAALSTVYYPRATNPSGFVTGVIAGTNITVVNNGLGGWTINSTASGSSSTGALTGAFYPLNANPSGYVQSTSGTVTIVGGGTVLNGQLLIGASGDNSFVVGGLTAGSGIGIVSGSGTLTINSMFTGIIAGTNITTSSNGQGGWTINSTASGSGIGGSGDVVTTGNQTLSNKKIRFTAAHVANNTWDGLSIFGLNAGATIAQWETVYLGGSSTWLLADANGTNTYPARGMAAAAYSSGNAAEIITQGTVRYDTWNWTPGGSIYLSTTAGAITQTAPSASGDKVQVVGYALTADIAYLDFNGEYITVQ